MRVQSLSYLLFLLIVWLLVWPVRAAAKRQLILLLASYVFYASWGLGFLAALVFSSLMNYLMGEALRRRPTAGVLWIGVILNVAFLATFKYLPSLAANGPAAAGPTDLLSRIIMPVGISFWSFQALSYLFDVYRGETLDPSLVEFCLYLAFWPTVLAGPVCRLPTVLPQVRRAPFASWDDVAIGVRRIVIGLFMKMVLAQTLQSGLNPGEGVAAGFDQVAAAWGAIDVWLLAIGYGFQLFFDFAGYSHIAIGSARLFGIHLEENFDRPYLSVTPSAFWTRWHMSLSSWIRDYVFVPLATARRDVWWRQVALAFSMAVFGLWHGARSTFILWGLYHGVLLVGHRQIQRLRLRFTIRLPRLLDDLVSWSVTLALVSLGWLFFRAHDLPQALTMLGTVLSPGSYGTLALRPNCYFVTSLVIGGYFLFTGTEALIVRWASSPQRRRIMWLLAPAYYAAAILLTIVWSKQESVFIYFQF